MSIYGHNYDRYDHIQARRVGSRRAPFFVQSFSPPHIGAPMGSQKMAQRDTKWSPKTQTASEAVLGCKKDPKKGTKRNTQSSQGPQNGSKGCQNDAQGKPNLPHELFQSQTRIRDSSGTHFMEPKGSQKGLQNHTHFQTFSCINLGPVLAPVGDQK